MTLTFLTHTSVARPFEDTLKVPNLAFFTHKTYDEHPCPFYMGFPS